MQPGRYYLLRIKSEATEKADYFRAYAHDSVILVISADEADKLKDLSPRIVVLRTMNIQVDRLESEIRTLLINSTH